jgi:hypothetical protein
MRGHREERFEAVRRFSAPVGALNVAGRERGQ